MPVTISKSTERRNTEDLRQRRIDSLVWIGGVIILLDTIWGGLASLGLNLSSANELLVAISFVLGLPVYVLDLRLDTRISFWLIGLFFFRWIAMCFAGPTYSFVANPVRGNVLLIVSFALLQTYKLARSAPEGRETS